MAGNESAAVGDKIRRVRVCCKRSCATLIDCSGREGCVAKCNAPSVFAKNLAKTVACGRVIERERGSKTAPFTLSLPGLPAFLAVFSILQQSLGYPEITAT